MNASENNGLKYSWSLLIDFMQKNKRKQFKIKEMKKDGLSYPEIEEKIGEEKKMSVENKKFIRDILKEKPKVHKQVFDKKTIEKELKKQSERMKHRGLGSWDELNCLWELKNGTLEKAQMYLDRFTIFVDNFYKKNNIIDNQIIKKESIWIKIKKFIISLFKK